MPTAHFDPAGLSPASWQAHTAWGYCQYCCDRYSQPLLNFVDNLYYGNIFHILHFPDPDNDISILPQNWPSHLPNKIMCGPEKLFLKY
jgi:hypothetical protein